MSVTDLGTTNTWLALIALASMIQTLVVVGLLVGAYRFYRRTEDRIDRIQREHVAPVAARAHAVLDKVEDVMDRLRSIDDRVERALARAGDRLGLVTAVARRKFWPVVGLVRGLRIGWATFTERRPESGRTTQADREADRRFTYEGGTSHAGT